MDNFSHKRDKINIDIRAAQKFRFPNGHSLVPSFLLLITDVCALGSAWQVAAYLNKFYSPIPEQLVWWVWWGIPSLFWVFATITILFFGQGGLYSFSQDNYLKIAQLISLVYLLSLVISYFYDPKLDPPRSLFFTAWFSSITIVIGFRLLITLISRQFIRPKAVLVYIIANAHRLPKLASVLQKRSDYQVVGTALSTDANSDTTLQAIFDSGAQSVLAEDLPKSQLASTLYWQLRRRGISLRLIPSSVEMLHRRGVPEIFASLPTVRLEIPLVIGWDYRLKRWLDIIGAFFGVIILSPLFLTAAIAIKLSSPGFVFFRQERMGLQGKVFHVWKFRTMVVNATELQTELEEQNETKDGIMFKIKLDPRITPIGNILRRTSIDELPQLFNVLLGQMSLVGPRPLPLRDVERFQDWHHIRHQVLPGITGLWQISGRSDIEDFDDAVRLDLYYIDNWSLNLDLDILLETVRIVLFGKGAY